MPKLLRLAKLHKSPGSTKTISTHARARNAHARAGMRAQNKLSTPHGTHTHAHERTNKSNVTPLIYLTHANEQIRHMHTHAESTYTYQKKLGPAAGATNTCTSLQQGDMSSLKLRTCAKSHACSCALLNSLRTDKCIL